MNDGNKEGLDLAGLGKLAKAIPPEVYTQSTELVTNSFEKLIAPITESTSGLGRYVKQKFDNLVETEKALATYTIQNAITKSEQKSKENGTSLITPVHAKSFIKAIEESSRETDPTLHEMWENLLVNQLTNINSHPHFVEILPHFSPAEAIILMSLVSKEEVGDNEQGYMGETTDSFKHWIIKSYDERLNEWTYSCDLLQEFKFANVLPPIGGTYKAEDKVTILYKTMAGITFLDSVT